MNIKKILIVLIMLSYGYIPFALTNQKFFMVSPPKTGTHLLKNAITLLSRRKATGSKGGDDWLNLFEIEESRLKKLNEELYYTTHAPAMPKNIAIAKKNNLKGFFIIRDPRDQIVSAARYILEFPGLKDKISLNDLITVMINTDYNHGTLLPKHFYSSTTPSVVDFYDLYMPWSKQPFIYTTKFEDLVGPRGGGDKANQIREIKNIAKHLGVSISDEDANYVSNKIFGNSLTFRQGQIGGWKTVFTSTNKEDFKRVAGNLLIELGYEPDLNW